MALRRRAGPRAAAFVFVTVLIDAMGIGIIIPVMPDLIRELTDLPLGAAALWGGYLSFVYALMQFAFGPTLGNLSDRFGRRPVLLVSLLALAVDYLVMGFAPTLWLLFAGRALAGIAGATYSTANAFMADVSPPDRRAQNFGLIGAGFGVGFIAGPLIGGLAAELGTRAPFFVAAALAMVNFAYGALVLPETLARENRRRFDWRRANPFGAARQIMRPCRWSRGSSSRCSCSTLRTTPIPPCGASTSRRLSGGPMPKSGCRSPSSASRSRWPRAG